MSDTLGCCYFCAVRLSQWQINSINFILRNTKNERKSSREKAIQVSAASLTRGRRAIGKRHETCTMTPDKLQSINVAYDASICKSLFDIISISLRAGLMSVIDVVIIFGPVNLSTSIDDVRHARHWSEKKTFLRNSRRYKEASTPPIGRRQ